MVQGSAQGIQLNAGKRSFVYFFFLLAFKNLKSSNVISKKSKLTFNCQLSVPFYSLGSKR